ncbi:MAG: HXXEE domain-containing protein [Planctomycetota bacterium]|jgi:hypothetical protein
MKRWNGWLLVIAASVHVLEEYLLDWVAWAKTFVPTVTLQDFLLVNALFLLLCLGTVFSRSWFYRLVVAALFLVNTLLHLVPTVALGSFSPGVWSACFLYVPVALHTFHTTATAAKLTPRSGILAFLVALALMGMPVLWQLMR